MDVSPETFASTRRGDPVSGHPRQACLPEHTPGADARTGAVARDVDEAMLACERLARAEVNLVTWRRELPSDLADELAHWTRRSPARFDDILSGSGFDLSTAMGGLAEPARAWLQRDVAQLLDRLAHVADSRRLRVSFGAVRTDQCRKFHVDYVRYRLITTYVGPGTEWVPEEAVRHEALDHPPDCPCDANKEIVRDASAIRHAVPGEVILMKGALHPGHRGAVHRSPPIEGTGRVRVVLIASTVDRS